MRKENSSISCRRRTALALVIAVLLAPILHGVPPVEKQLSQRSVPFIFESVEPAELGQPAYAPVAGTSLLWVSNTESDLFSLGATGAYYLHTFGIHQPTAVPLGTTLYRDVRSGGSDVWSIWRRWRIGSL